MAKHHLHHMVLLLELQRCQHNPPSPPGLPYMGYARFHKKIYWQGIFKTYSARLFIRFPLTTVFPLFQCSRLTSTADNKTKMSFNTAVFFFCISNTLLYFLSAGQVPESACLADSCENHSRKAVSSTYGHLFRILRVSAYESFDCTNNFGGIRNGKGY